MESEVLSQSFISHLLRVLNKLLHITRDVENTFMFKVVAEVQFTVYGFQKLYINGTALK